MQVQEGKRICTREKMATYIYTSRRGEYEQTPAVMVEAPLKLMLPNWHGGSTATPL